jgi:hypothetical protein
MYTFNALQIFIFLIPGFISSKFLDSLVIRKQDQKELTSIVEALILSMVIYTIYSLTGLPSPVTLDQVNSTFSYNYDSKSFIILLGISIVLPLLLAFVVNNDLHMGLARVFKITKKTSRLSVWHDIFYDKKPLVIIDFTDNRRLFGWVEHFSDDPDKPYLFVAQPQWVIDDKYIPTGLEGMLITPEEKISFIEFLKDETDQNVETNRTIEEGARNVRSNKSRKSNKS